MKPFWIYVILTLTSQPAALASGNNNKEGKSCQSHKLRRNDFTISGTHGLLAKSSKCPYKSRFSVNTFNVINKRNNSFDTK